jgi:hypothetical protein
VPRKRGLGRLDAQASIKADPEIHGPFLHGRQHKANNCRTCRRAYVWHRVNRCGGVNAGASIHACRCLDRGNGKCRAAGLSLKGGLSGLGRDGRIDIGLPDDDQIDGAVCIVKATASATQHRRYRACDRQQLALKRRSSRAVTFDPGRWRFNHPANRDRGRSVRTSRIRHRQSVADRTETALLGWRRAVMKRTRLWAKFPASWEITGNFVRLGLRVRLLARNPANNSMVCDAIPYASEQGIISP